MAKRSTAVSGIPNTASFTQIWALGTYQAIKDMNIFCNTLLSLLHMIEVTLWFHQG